MGSYRCRSFIEGLYTLNSAPGVSLKSFGGPEAALLSPPPLKASLAAIVTGPSFGILGTFRAAGFRVLGFLGLRV